MNVKTGSYVGTGSAQSIDVGFLPKSVIVKRNDSTVAQWATDTMGGMTKPLTNTALQSNRITALSGTTFSLGTDVSVNENGVTYFYLALGGTGVHTGNYAGNATNNRPITGVGFTPGWLIIGAEGGDLPGWRTSDYPTDGFSRFDSLFGNLTNCVRSLNSDGFNLGTNNITNGGSGRVYNYLAVESDGVNATALGYTGDGTDDRSITGVGFQPVFTIIRNNTSAAASTFRFADQVGDNSFEVGTGLVANHIQALEADGFQIGTDVSVNTNTEAYKTFSLTEVQTSNVKVKASGEFTTASHKIKVSGSFVEVNPQVKSGGIWS